MARRRVIVVGGANTDIGGEPAQRLVRHDSNPGRVTIRHGGVGRNIACNLAQLGLDVRLLTALGTDGLSATLQEDCRARGVDTSLSRVVEDARGSVYLYVADEKGEMEETSLDISGLPFGTNDVALTPDFLCTRLDILNAADAVVLDANLDAASIAYLCENLTVPLYADPVSGAKAPRLAAVLDRLSAIKPNLLEARVLTGKSSPEDCAEALLEKGAGSVFLSLGADGILAASGEERIFLPAERTEIVSSTGAGDAATAAIVWAEGQGLELAAAACAAVRAGAITASDEETVSPELKAEALI